MYVVCHWLKYRYAAHDYICFSKFDIVSLGDIQKLDEEVKGHKILWPWIYAIKSFPKEN